LGDDDFPAAPAARREGGIIHLMTEDRNRPANHRLGASRAKSYAAPLLTAPSLPWSSSAIVAAPSAGSATTETSS
jgi:hypothetical protein